MYIMLRHPIKDLLGPRVRAPGDDITGVHEDIPRSGIIVDLAEEVLQVVELTMDVPDEKDTSGPVHRWDVECGGLGVFTKIRFLYRQRPRGDAGEKEIEEESREDSEGGHGADRKAGCLAFSIAHGRYKYPSSTFQNKTGLIRARARREPRDRGNSSVTGGDVGISDPSLPIQTKKFISEITQAVGEKDLMGICTVSSYSEDRLNGAPLSSDLAEALRVHDVGLLQFTAKLFHAPVSGSVVDMNSPTRLVARRQNFSRGLVPLWRLFACSTPRIIGGPFMNKRARRTHVMLENPRRPQTTVAGLARTKARELV